ncbi:MAG TPA: glycosyltransferase family 39 protein, partial [Thermoanaerobaculia bacterium]|nr:glycosyltransferase family 39 protein [Thermoanaerobaculia bacterium]
MDARTLSPSDSLDEAVSGSPALDRADAAHRPRDRATSWTLAGGLGIALALAAAKLAVHLLPVGAFGYGFFVDELYYLAASEHLAWGFVDMPPLVPALTALVRATLGESLLAVRLLPAVAGAALVVLTAWLARRLGAGRWAQALAALAVLVAPIRLAVDSFHSMNALEPLFWMGCAAVLIRLLDGGNPRWWLVFGALAGVGLLNKHSMAFFGAAVVVALAATPEGRRAFRERWLWLGGLLALAIFLPNLVWMASHGFPHLEMLANIRADGRNVALSPVAFLAQQALAHHPLALPLWLVGLGWFLFGNEGRRYRVLGIVFLVVIAEMLLTGGRIYYPAPVYPMMLAGGAVAFERWLAQSGKPSGSDRGAGWRSTWKPAARRALPVAYGAL